MLIVTILGFLLLATSLFTLKPVLGDTNSTFSSVTDENVLFDIGDENVCLQNNTPNLIQNPSFEGEYGSYTPPTPIDDCQFGVCQTAQIPKDGGWVPFWRSHNNNDPGYIIRQPEYKPACVGTDPCVFADRLRDGKEALQYFTFFSTHEAGIMQTVSVTPGETYCLSGWGHSWSAQDDDDAISGPEDGQLRQKIGIDPMGGTDWNSSNIIWSDQEESKLGRIQYDEYGLFTVTGKAKTEKMTVFFYSQPAYAVKHNNVYWDDTHLSMIPSIYTTTLTTTADIAILTTVSETIQLSQTVQFKVVGSGSLESYSWSAVISNTNGITPTLSQASGGLTDTLTITTSSAGLAVGSYSADVVINTTPETGNAPFTIPVRVTVADRLYSTYLPMILRE